VRFKNSRVSFAKKRRRIRNADRHFQRVGKSLKVIGADQETDALDANAAQITDGGGPIPLRERTHIDSRRVNDRFGVRQLSDALAPCGHSLPAHKDDKYDYDEHHSSDNANGSRIH
jgi:hypothetical protein